MKIGNLILKRKSGRFGKEMYTFSVLCFVASGSEECSAIMGDVPPQYSNLEEMAMKVQTSSEKKAGKTTKKGGKKSAEESEKVSCCTV